MIRIKMVGVTPTTVWNIHTGNHCAKRVVFASKKSQLRAERAAGYKCYPNGYSFRRFCGEVVTPFGVASVELERHGRSWFLERVH